MQIVINIKDSTYEAIKNEYCILPPQKGLLKILWDAIRNGTPLPKGHGDLINADNLRNEMKSWGMNDYEPSDFIDEIDRTDVVIKADKKQSEDKE